MIKRREKSILGRHHESVDEKQHRSLLRLNPQNSALLKRERLQTVLLHCPALSIIIYNMLSSDFNYPLTKLEGFNEQDWDGEKKKKKKTRRVPVKRSHHR